MAGIAYIFPGQGSQYVGMGKDLFDEIPAARRYYEQADTLLGVELSKICFEGPEAVLRQTANTQPAIFLHSILLTRLVGLHDVRMAAGHSLGEYSALVFAGAIDFADGLRLVRLRGELMQRAGEEQKGTMAAIVGLEPTVVESLCVQASSAGVVQCANYNSPGQIVISGSTAGVQCAMELAKAAGARLVKELIVSGAFHSPLMESARQGLQEALKKAAIRDAKIPVYTNVTAKPVQKAEEIRTLLELQLTNPVRWEEGIQNMIIEGATKFVEIGPGKVLQGLVKRISTNSEVTGIDRLEDIQKKSEGHVHVAPQK
jgi:[acyl-carrier-protein] S-malonyltransferase